MFKKQVKLSIKNLEDINNQLWKEMLGLRESVVSLSYQIDVLAKAMHLTIRRRPVQVNPYEAVDSGEVNIPSCWPGPLYPGSLKSETTVSSFKATTDKSASNKKK